MALTRRTFLQLLGLSPVVASTAVAATQPKEVPQWTVERDFATRRHVYSNGNQVVFAVADEQIIDGIFVAKRPPTICDLDGDEVPLVAKAQSSLSGVMGIALNSAPAGGIVNVLISGRR